MLKALKYSGYDQTVSETNVLEIIVHFYKYLDLAYPPSTILDIKFRNKSLFPPIDISVKDYFFSSEMVRNA